MGSSQQHRHQRACGRDDALWAVGAGEPIGQLEHRARGDRRQYLYPRATSQTSLSLPTERGKEISADFIALTPPKCDNPPAPPSCAKNTLCPTPFLPSTSRFTVSSPSPQRHLGRRLGRHHRALGWQAWRSAPVAVAGGRDLFDVWASGPSDVWVVGADTPSTGGITLHYNGTTWTAVPNGSSWDLNGIHGLSANEIYAVGDPDPVLGGPGEFWRWNGSTWTAMSNSVNGQLWRVFAVSSTEIWAMGFQNTLIKHSGTSANFVSLSSIGATATTEFRHMWGTGNGNLFLVGSNGFAAHYNGTWSRMTQGATTSTLYAVQGTTSTGRCTRWATTAGCSPVIRRTRRLPRSRTRRRIDQPARACDCAGWQCLGRGPQRLPRAAGDEVERRGPADRPEPWVALVRVHVGHAVLALGRLDAWNASDGIAGTWDDQRDDEEHGAIDKAKRDGSARQDHAGPSTAGVMDSSFGLWVARERRR